MRYLAAAHTDVGIVKKVNQDAFCLKLAKTSNARIAFAIICDGMGGLQNGELASSLVVNAYSAWFENELPSLVKSGLDFNQVRARWNEIAQEQNQKIGKYGQDNSISLGTTLSGLLLFEDQYLYIQVGDSRIYQLGTAIEQITKDQTVVELDVEKRRITREQAQSDTRKNVLLQCIGASKTIVPVCGSGNVAENEAFLLCSDGFRHEVSDEELFGVLAPALLSSEKIMKNCLKDLIDLNKSRNEKDNITALLIKAIR